MIIRFHKIMSDGKHENYEILNLMGYGLAKFDMDFVKQFGCQTKTQFYEEMVKREVGETVGVIKNRQDLFDPFFDNDRKGWWQKGDAYIHRKHFIDSLFGSYDAKGYADIVKLYLEDKFQITDFQTAKASPIIKSSFKQLQLTGREAELYFKENYEQVETFKGGLLNDARLLGDGYDFQIQIETNYLLAEVKGIRKSYGAFRMTEREFARADEYKNDYGLIIISNLENVPKMTAVFNPLANIALEKHERTTQQISYHSKSMIW